MWYVYILYSVAGTKTYVGFTNDVERRIFEHNVSESKGFTLRYRPWLLIHQEIYAEKKLAMVREKFLKSGHGREEVKLIVKRFLDGAVSALAEKD